MRWPLHLALIPALVLAAAPAAAGGFGPGSHAAAGCALSESGVVLHRLARKTP